MTIRELSKYNHIKHEIAQIQDNIEELYNTAIGSTRTTGMPHGNIVSNPTEMINIKRQKLEKLLEKKQEQLIDEQLKIEEFLNTVEENTIRVIIRARFINDKKWEEIGEELNFDRTTPYYHLKKYLKEHR